MGKIFNKNKITITFPPHWSLKELDKMIKRRKTLGSYSQYIIQLIANDTTEEEKDKLCGGYEGGSD